MSVLQKGLLYMDLELHVNEVRVVVWNTICSCRTALSAPKKTELNSSSVSNLNRLLGWF